MKIKRYEQMDVLYDYQLNHGLGILALCIYRKSEMYSNS
jgi:hypothetical protein